MKKALAPQFDWKGWGVFVVVSFLFGALGAVTFVSVFTPESRQVVDVRSSYEIIPDIVSAANDAVVTIEILQEGTDQSFEAFREFYGIPLPKVEDTKEGSSLRQIGGGSGFVITEDGLIVTNKHVVESETAVFRIRLSNGETYPATIVAEDPVLDLAFLKIEKRGMAFLTLGNSDDVRIGEQVIAIGYSLAEYGNSVTTGIVSGLGRKVEAGNGIGTTELLREAIQTDAAINLGNSGGPLLNMKGEVIGINTAVSTKGQSVGFAIPVNRMKKSAESVAMHGEILRPRLGIRYIPVTPKMAQEQKLPVTYGALIVDGTNGEPGVVPKGPADTAGIQVGDIILEIDGVTIDDRDTLSVEIAQKNIGDEVLCKVLRNGEELTIRATLDAFPPNN